MCSNIKCLIVLFASIISITVAGPLSAQESGEPIELKVREAPSTAVAVTSMHQWVVKRMSSWMPPGRSFIKDAKETPEAGKKRYEEIADALIRVVYNPKEKVIFGGKYGRAKTMALLLSMAYFESGYRKDVDFGIGPLGRGDGGQSWCMMQIMLSRPGPDGKTLRRVVFPKTGRHGIRIIFDRTKTKGWGGEDLVKDRMKCFTAGLREARLSFRACPRIPIEDRLSVYGAGRCITNFKGSRIRVRKAQKWLAVEKPPMTDDEVKSLLYPSEKPVEDEKLKKIDVSEKDKETPPKGPKKVSSLVNYGAILNVRESSLRGFHLPHVRFFHFEL